MSVTYNWITGFCLGIEFFDDEDHGRGVMLDVGIIRFLFFFEEY